MILAGLKNHGPRKLVCVDCKARVARRYEDRKRTGVARIPTPQDWRVSAALEIFRDRGAPNNTGGKVA